MTRAFVIVSDTRSPAKALRNLLHLTGGTSCTLSATSLLEDPTPIERGRRADVLIIVETPATRSLTLAARLRCEPLAWPGIILITLTPPR